MHCAERAKHRNSGPKPGWTQSKVFPGTLFHAGHAATTMCRGDGFLAEAAPAGMGKVEATQRDEFETKRHAVVGPGRDTF